MSVPPPRQPVTDALATMLTSATGHDWFDSDAQWGQSGRWPYGIVEQLPGGAPVGGVIGHPDDMVAVTWQATAVGRTPAQAHGLMDRARTAILARDATGAHTHPLPAAPTVVIARRWDTDAGVTLEADVVNVAERFTLILMTDPLHTPG